MSALPCSVWTMSPLASPRPGAVTLVNPLESVALTLITLVRNAARATRTSPCKFSMTATCGPPSGPCGRAPEFNIGGSNAAGLKILRPELGVLASAAYENASKTDATITRLRGFIGLTFHQTCTRDQSLRLRERTRRDTSKFGSSSPSMGHPSD